MPIDVLDRNNQPQTEFTIGDLMVLFGQAIASPDPYTLMDRVKQVTDALIAPRPPGENHIGSVGGHSLVQEAEQPLVLGNYVTDHVVGDLVANDVVPTAVLNLQFNIGRVTGGTGAIVGAQLQKSSNNIDGAVFRLHLFSLPPTYITGGDNSPLTTVVVASDKAYLGYIDIKEMIAFSDVAWGSGSPDNSRGAITFVADTQSIYGLLEARGVYTAASLESFRPSLDVIQD